MQDEKSIYSPRGRCQNCGKEIAVRDSRNPVAYCGRVCAQMERYKKRYKGTLYGKAIRDHIKEKMKQL